MAQNFRPKAVQNSSKTAQNGSKPFKTPQNNPKRPKTFENVKDGRFVLKALPRRGGGVAAAAGAAVAVATAPAAVAAAGPKEPSLIASISRLVPLFGKLRIGLPYEGEGLETNVFLEIDAALGPI